MRRYVTIGGIVVATVLVGSAAAYAGPEVLAPRAVSVVNADQPGPTGSATPSASVTPSPTAPPAAAAPCPPAPATPPSAGAAPSTAVAPTTTPAPADPPAAVVPTTAPAPTTEPAPSTLPAPPTPAGGAFQAAPAKAVPDVPAAGGGSTEGAPSAESSGHDGPGDGKSGHDKQKSGDHDATGQDAKGHDSNGQDAKGHDSNSHDSNDHGSGKQDPSAKKPGDQDGSDMSGASTPPATPAPAPSAPSAPAPADCAPPAASPSTAAPSTPDTSAATAHGWGTPSRVDNFDGSKLDSSWSVYDGPGHNGAGRRTPDAIKVDNGIMTMTGDDKGNSGGMAWQPGQRYGRWEARVRSHAGDPNYHAVMLLWPDAENWPVGGEIDFMEISDPTRQNTQMFLHYGQNNQQVQGSVDIDATQWHDWAVEWAPTGVTAYVDGKVWWSTKDTSILPPGPMHMTIQLDNFGGTNMKTTSMDVDWVKEYKLAPAEGAPAAAGGLVEGAADAVGQATRPLTEGAPDPIPAVTGLVADAVRG